MKRNDLWKNMTRVTAMLAALAALVWQFDARVDCKLEAAEERIMGAVEMFEYRQAITTQKQKVDILREQREGIRRDLQFSPTDRFLREEYDRVSARLETAENKLQQLLEQ